MAGHSKWANIKHKKAREDAKRGKVFSVIVKKISAAARRGGGDVDMNPELRLHVAKAKAANMPAANIERAILKATGQLEGISYSDFTYEGYGPGGVAIIVSGATDNKNRTVGNIRYAFTKHGGNLGENGCVSWMFHEKGIIAVDEESVDDIDTLMELALENGAEDFEQEDGVVTITTEPDDFVAVREAVEAAGLTEFIQDEITLVADNSLAPGLSETKRNLTLIDVLEEDDDVESVAHNLEISDEVAAELG